jgi:hypothetical protein
MNYFGVLTKLVNLVSATMGRAKAYVNTYNDLTDPFEVHRELKQGDRLAPVLFNTPLEYAIQHLLVDVNSPLI